MCLMGREGDWKGGSADLLDLHVGLNSTVLVMWSMSLEALVATLLVLEGEVDGKKGVRRIFLYHRVGVYLQSDSCSLDVF